MKRILFFVFLLSGTEALFTGCRTPQPSHPSTRNFDLGWLFKNDSLPRAEQPGYDDSGWRKIDLPHDWSVEDLPGQVEGKVMGPFSITSAGGMNTGYFIGGTGWYRKKFTVDTSEAHKLIRVNFDGVYMDCDTWINGHYLGNHPYGYTPFYYYLTPFLNPAGSENVLAVRVRNLGLNSRWYTGSGIYRHVTLTLTDSVHLSPNGVYITTSKLSNEDAEISVTVSVDNASEKVASVNVRTEILDKNGAEAGRSEDEVSVAPGATATISHPVSIKKPMAWSPGSPDLYLARVTVSTGKNILDGCETKFGIRTIRVDAGQGLILNGEKVLLKGGCMHHDNGLLGSATFDRAEERRVELMKSFGFNAIRTSHNPPSSQFLDACDRIGILVIDEAFDMWERPKNPQDYARFFDEWGKKDIESMVLRDRNHPSVIFWSIGNEVNERADSSGLKIARMLVDEVKKLDPTRPVTEAICDFWDHLGKSWDATAPAFALLDVGGYNYQWRKYETDHRLYPDRVMMGTESIAMEAFQNWNMVEHHPYVIGDFVWTAMDYMGETAIGHRILDNEKNDFRLPWPWFNSYCGDIDLIGGKKPQSYYRDVIWNISPIEMLVHTPIPAGRKEVISYWGWPDEWPSWNWEGHEKGLLGVRVFTRCSRVRLELNGKVIGEQPVDSLLTAVFHVPYQPGELKAVGIENGKESSVKVLQTTGDPSAIKLVPDRAVIHADRNDLSYIKTEIVDNKGNVVPDADFLVKFEISGAGELAGAGSACPNRMASFQKPECTTYHGLGMLIIRSTGIKGNVEVKASALGLAGSETEVRVE